VAWNVEPACFASLSLSYPQIWLEAAVMARTRPIFLVTKGNPMNNTVARARVASLLMQAEAIIESREATEPNGRWALTAFSRYRACELLGVTPYGPYRGELTGDPVALLEEVATAVDALDVSLEELSWRLAASDALRTAAADVRAVQDARDI
jgi:hypothetical protein